MNDLNGAVAKTMNFVFADIENSVSDKHKRLALLKANIGKVATIPLAEIETNENVRHSIDVNSAKFLQLLESIKKYGILENIVAELRVNKKGTDYKLICVAGHRRILAAHMAKTITKVPCLLVAPENKGDQIGMALAENLNREDLHCLDVAEGYQQLINNGWSVDEISHHFCRDVRTVKHYLKMAEWSLAVKELLREHSEVFSTRVIMRQFAYRKYDGDGALLDGIRNFLAPPKVVKKAKTSVLTMKEHQPKVLKDNLEKYLVKQKYLSTLIKDEIRKAFIELDLI